MRARAKDAEAREANLHAHYRGEQSCPDQADACWGCTLRDAEARLATVTDNWTREDWAEAERLRSLPFSELERLGRLVGVNVSPFQSRRQGAEAIISARKRRQQEVQ